jgi:diaminopimelate epimerase
MVGGETIPFEKLSGAGNDFVVVDNRDGRLDPTSEFVAKVCARRLSVGADGLLLVEKPDDAGAADFRMRYFNADGGEVETCGNGARCIARFAYRHGIAPATMRFETLAGIYGAQVLGERVKVQMSDPKDVRLAVPLSLREGEFTVACVNSGVPHVVFVVDDADGVDVVGLGRQTRYHRDFAPVGTNANFVQVVDAQTLRVRTYERGVEDETLACGTGAIASAVTLAMMGRVSPPVAVRTQGGFTLAVHFRLSGGVPSDVHLEGDARLIYAGEVHPDAWRY